MNPQPEPLAIGLEEELTTRRPVTVEQHKLFIDSLLSEADLDEIDEILVVDPYEVHAPSRRSDKDLASLLDLLDSLETSNSGKAQA